MLMENAKMYHSTQESATGCGLLLKYGAQINAVDKHGRTALMMACQTSNHAKVQILINHGSDINAKDHEGRSALLFLLYGWYHDGLGGILETLLQHGADANVMDDSGCDALCLVEKSGSKDLLLILNKQQRKEQEWFVELMKVVMGAKSNIMTTILKQQQHPT